MTVTRDCLLNMRWTKSSLSTIWVCKTTALTVGVRDKSMIVEFYHQWASYTRKTIPLDCKNPLERFVNVTAPNISDVDWYVLRYDNPKYRSSDCTTTEMIKKIWCNYLKKHHNNTKYDV